MHAQSTSSSCARPGRVSGRSQHPHTRLLPGSRSSFHDYNGSLDFELIELDTGNEEGLDMIALRRLALIALLRVRLQTGTAGWAHALEVRTTGLFTAAPIRHVASRALALNEHPMTTLRR